MAQRLDDVLGHIDPRAADHVSRLMTAAGERGLLGGLPPTAAAELFETFHRNYKAAATYRPAPYDGPVLLFRAVPTPDAPDAGWGELVRELEVVTVEADHYTIMAGSRLQQVARAMAARLAG